MPNKILIQTLSDAFDFDEISDTREVYHDRLESVDLNVSFDDANALTYFNSLPQSVLPILPFGYQWVQDAKSKRSIVKDACIPNSTLDLILYGNKDSYNYNFLIDNRNTQSFAHTKATCKLQRDFPMTLANYAYGGQHYVRGHCIDHSDTLYGGGITNSSYLKQNYIPETPKSYWGLHVRRVLVDKQRSGKNAYMQFVDYPDQPLKTNDGTAIPNDVYFYNINDNHLPTISTRYTPVKIFNIDWSKPFVNPRKLPMLTLASQRETAILSAPVSYSYNLSITDDNMNAQMDNLTEQVKKIKLGEIKSYNADRDTFFKRAAIANREFASIDETLKFAISASENGKPSVARLGLFKAVAHGKKIKALDKKKPILSEENYQAIKKKINDEAPGFEDKKDDMLDTLRQLRSAIP